MKEKQDNYKNFDNRYWKVIDTLVEKGIMPNETMSNCVGDYTALREKIHFGIRLSDPEIELLESSIQTLEAECKEVLQ